MRITGGASVTLFLAVLLSVGCSSDGVFDNPDSIRVTTLESIHGMRGHRVDITIGPNNENPDDAGMTKQVVLALHDPEVTDHTLYLVIATDSIGVGKMIDLLKQATDIAIVPDLPGNTKPRTRLVLNFGGTHGDSFAGYLKVTAPTETAYLSLRGTVTAERRAWFLKEVRKPPTVLDTMPATVVEIRYYLDQDFTVPIVGTVYVSDTVYTKVVFSKPVPAVIADDGSAFPHITSTVEPTKEFQYRMKPSGAPLMSGDAQPYRNTDNIFICKYVVQGVDAFDNRVFCTHANHDTVSGDTLRISFYSYDGTMPAVVGETITNWQPDDFVGRVYTLHPSKISEIGREQAEPLAGVTVTVASGSRKSEHTLTDRNGRYLFPNVAGDTLHLRVERYHFEPKEVLVHRFRPTALANGDVPNFSGDPQRDPGNILMGLAWPDEVRSILEEVQVVHDLLYAETGVEDSNRAGFYIDGVVGIFANTKDWVNPHAVLHTFAHEIVHAHQHAVLSVDGGAHSNRHERWLNSSEGRAFAAAKDRDVETTAYDNAPHYRDNLFENAAETGSYYLGERWGVEFPARSYDQMGKTMKEIIPNRYRWAEQWLIKK